MRQVILKKFMRITKWEARELFNKGENLIVCPVNLRPGEPYNPECTVCSKDYEDFDGMVRWVTHFNCTNKETGKYLAYYRTTQNQFVACDGITFSE